MKYLSIIALLSLLGCQPVLKIAYGIKSPWVENEKTIRTKAYKYKLDTSNIVTVHSSHFLRMLKDRSIPDGAIYDRAGNYIEYRKTDSSCNAGLNRFISELNLNDIYNQPDTTTLFPEFEKFRRLNGEKLSLTDSADFYLLLYWTTWAGRLNKDHVKIWEDLAKKNKHCRIKVIKVNLDIQSYWENEERENIIHTMSQRK